MDKMSENSFEETVIMSKNNLEETDKIRQNNFEEMGKMSENNLEETDKIRDNNIEESYIIIGCAAFADDADLDLAGVIQLVLDLLCDIAGQHYRFRSHPLCL